jgi:hypothetical protein
LQFTCSGERQARFCSQNGASTVVSPRTRGRSATADERASRSRGASAGPAAPYGQPLATLRRAQSLGISFRQGDFPLGKCACHDIVNNMLTNDRSDPNNLISL